MISPGNFYSKDEVYKILYNRINDKYDVRNPILAYLVRDCIDNQGVISNSKTKEIASLQYDIYYSNNTK